MQPLVADSEIPGGRSRDRRGANFALSHGNSARYFSHNQALELHPFYELNVAAHHAALFEIFLVVLLSLPELRLGSNLGDDGLAIAAGGA